MVTAVGDSIEMASISISLFSMRLRPVVSGLIPDENCLEITGTGKNFVFLFLLSLNVRIGYLICLGVFFYVR